MSGRTSSTLPSNALLAALAVLALVLGLWAARTFIDGPGKPPELTIATRYPAPKPFAEMALTDHRGSPFGLDALRGKWSFLFFGYTHCPDICPTTMAMLNTFDRKLAEQPALHRDAQVVFVSVDPERDTVERLAQFVPYFNKAFIGVTGPEAQIASFTRALGILYQRSAEQSSDAGYLVDHSASVLLIDPDARLHAVFSPPHDPTAMMNDFSRLRTYYEESR